MFSDESDRAEFALAQRELDARCSGWIDAKMTVDEAMRRWPITIRVFLDFRMRCAGCPIACFHSIDEACAEREVGAGVFVTGILENLKAAAYSPRLRT